MLRSDHSLRADADPRVYPFQMTRVSDRPPSRCRALYRRLRGATFFFPPVDPGGSRTPPGMRLFLCSSDICGIFWPPYPCRLGPLSPQVCAGPTMPWANGDPGRPCASIEWGPQTVTFDTQGGAGASPRRRPRAHHQNTTMSEARNTGFGVRTSRAMLVARVEPVPSAS